MRYDNDDTVPIFSSKSYLESKNTEQNSLHTSSLRALKFSEHSQNLISIGADRRINMIDLQSLELTLSQETNHKEALYSLLEVSPFVWATGDDNGGIKLWDFRLKTSENCVGQMNEQVNGTISSLAILNQPLQIAATSTQGNLGVYDIRTSKKQNNKLNLFALSDLMEEELNDVQVLKSGSVLACGTSSGVIQLYKKGWYGDCSDRITGHPFSVDTTVKYSENILITGSEDGWVRFSHVHPNKVVLFERHDEESEEGSDFPIMKVSLSRCKRFLASISNDRCVRFYELGDVDAAIKNKNQVNQDNHENEFSDIEEEDNEDDFSNNRQKKFGNPDMVKKQDFFKNF